MPAIISPYQKTGFDAFEKNLARRQRFIIPAADLQAHGPQRRARSTAVTAILSNRNGFRMKRPRILDLTAFFENIGFLQISATKIRRLQ
jgi:hypothetical protein